VSTLTHNNLASILNAEERQLPLILIESVFIFESIFLVDQAYLKCLYLEQLAAHRLKLGHSHRQEQLLVQGFAERRRHLGDEVNFCI
jgi:hypothetical protein